LTIIEMIFKTCLFILMEQIFKIKTYLPNRHLKKVKKIRHSFYFINFVFINNRGKI
jgi:hypothetical protein